MTDSPVLTVIVRSMDRPNLEAALQSVALQQLASAEVLVVPAAGRPHRPLPARVGLSTLRLATVSLQPLSRPAAANTGLAQALGEFVTFLDDDDVFLEGHLAKLVDALRCHPEVPAAYADVDYGRQTDEGWQSEHVFDAEFDPLRLRFENYLPIHAVLFRRHCTQAAAQVRFDEGQLLFEDWDFWLQLCELGPFVHVPGVSARYVAPSVGAASGVFDDAAPTQAARARLLEKWQRRESAQAHLALMDYVQRLFRSAGALTAELANARDELAGVRAVVQARERELADLDVHVSNLRTILASRDASLRDAEAHAAGLQAVLTARQDEIAAFAQQVEALRHEIEMFRAQPPLKAFAGAWKRKRNG